MANADTTAREKYLDLVFFTGFALLICHELDAVANAEWRLLPGLSGLDDEAGYRAFILLHIPLFALIMWWTASTRRLTRLRAQVAVDVFMVIHVGLHVLYRNHEHYTFQSTLSELCIYGAGVIGFLHAAAVLRSWR